MKTGITKRLKRRQTPLATHRSSLITEAERVLVGGVNSPVRAFKSIDREPIAIAKARAAVVTDLSGRTFVDCIMGWGALIHGHANPAVLQAVRHQLAQGWHFGLTSPSEVALARAIREGVPSIEQIRFTPSGTEACMAAIRLARGCTGRSKVLTFEGCYHGHSDGLLIKRGSGLATLGLAGSAGVPEAVAKETVVIPYNDVDALEEAFATFGPSIACAIIEPAAANMGVVVPELEFLRRLRTLTHQHGSLLIFDEVVTGFRLIYGGAQTLLGITPDLTVLGKVIGGGFPIGAFGGSKRFMKQLAPEGNVYHAGTFAGHPVSMAAGTAALEELRRRPPYERLEELSERLADGVQRMATRAGVPVHVNRLGSMLTIFFSGDPVRRFEEAKRGDTKRFARYANVLADAGVLVPPSQFEAMFLSAAHTREQIEQIIQATSKAFMDAKA